jgi:REP element-mobilizing transposase RayT
VREEGVVWGVGTAFGSVLRKLAEQKESRIEEGHLMPDHVHMMIAIPPKYAVSKVIGFIQGKSAIHLGHNLKLPALPGDIYITR